VSHYLKMSLFLLSGFGCIKASEINMFLRDEEYKRYFKLQEKIYQSLESLDIPGARPLNIDAALAEQVLKNCSKEVKQIIVGIEQSLFFENEKNIIFHGPSGTGKSVLAQAIAIRCKVPCLFFNVGTISTMYMNSGVQNLNKIFKYAQELEKSLGQPCIVIFDELESLTKKHASANNHEGNILISFWQELDRLCNSKVIVIGTMNSIEDVPDQIINRTSMIEIPLPTQKQRKVILSYYLKKIQKQYKLIYPQGLTADSLSRQTQGFSNRDLQNLVIIATKSVILASITLDGSHKMVTNDDFSSAIQKIKQSFIEKWKRTFKRYLYDPKIAISVVGLVLTALNIYNQMSARSRVYRCVDPQTN
jgi:AAA+ superfamily predicted ATPase